MLYNVERDLESKSEQLNHAVWLIEMETGDHTKVPITTLEAAEDTHIPLLIKNGQDDYVIYGEKSGDGLWDFTPVVIEDKSSIDHDTFEAKGFLPFEKGKPVKINQQTHKALYTPSFLAALEKGHSPDTSQFALLKPFEREYIQSYKFDKLKFNKDVQAWILRNPDRLDNKFTAIYLQLRALEKLQAALKAETSFLPLQIAMDHAIKELKDAPLYKNTKDKDKPRTPSRVLHVLSLVLVVPIAFAAYSAYKYGTMYYASNLDRKQTAEKALGSFKEKTKTLMSDAPKNRNR